jgi:hypothetical protein
MKKQVTLSVLITILSLAPLFCVNYMMRDGALYSLKGSKIAFTRDSSIYDKSGKRVGFLRDESIYDSHGKKLAFVRDGRVYDSHGRKIDSVDNTRKKIRDSIGELTPVSFWFFFIK